MMETHICAKFSIYLDFLHKIRWILLGQMILAMKIVRSDKICTKSLPNSVKFHKNRTKKIGIFNTRNCSNQYFAPLFEWVCSLIFPNNYIPIDGSTIFLVFLFFSSSVYRLTHSIVQSCDGLSISVVHHQNYDNSRMFWRLFHLL